MFFRFLSVSPWFSAWWPQGCGETFGRSRAVCSGNIKLVNAWFFFIARSGPSDTLVMGPTLALAGTANLLFQLTACLYLAEWERQLAVVEWYWGGRVLPPQAALTFPPARLSSKWMFTACVMNICPWTGHLGEEHHRAGIQGYINKLYIWLSWISTGCVLCTGKRVWRMA